MSICDLPVISPVCQTAGQAAGSLISAPFDWLASSAGAAAQWMFQGVWELFDSTTLVDLTKPGYVSVYNVIFGVAVFVMLTFFCLQLITGAIRRDPAALGRAALGLAKSVLGSFLVLTLMVTLLQIVDQLCVGIVQATGTTLEEMGAKIGGLVAGLTAISIGVPGAGAIITIFLSFLAITAAAMVWFSLLIRKALILVAIVMAPIALSGASWDATRGWFGKWASFLLALVFSKLVIVVVFLVAINQMNAPIDMDLSSIADPVAGIVLMFVAAFAPYMVYKFISFAGFDTYHVMSAEQESKQAMNRPIPTLKGPGGNGPKKILDGGNGDRQRSAPPPSNPPAEADGTAKTAETGSDKGTTAATSDAAAGGGAGTSADAGASTAAGAAAGPAGIAAIAGAKIAKGAAAAGPKLGAAVGRSADGHASASQDPQAPPPATSARRTPSAPPPSSAGPTTTT